MADRTRDPSLARLNRWAVILLGALIFVHAITDQYVAAAVLLSALYIGQLLVHAIERLGSEQ